MTDASTTGRLDGRAVDVTGGIGLGLAEAMAVAGAGLVIWSTMRTPSADRSEREGPDT